MFQKVLLVLCIAMMSASCRTNIESDKPSRTEETQLLDFQRAIQQVTVGKVPADLPRTFLGYVTLFNKRLHETGLENHRVEIQADPSTLAYPLLTSDLDTLRKNWETLFREVGIGRDIATDEGLAALNLRQFFWLITCVYQATLYRFELGHPIIRLDAHPVLSPTPVDR